MTAVAVALPCQLAAGPTEGRDPAVLRDAALRIDRHVADYYRRQNLAVPEVADDATFLRRVFLVVAGRIPTAEESRAFLEIGEPDKRAMLAEHLLNSPGYASHMANWTFDLLRVADRQTGNQTSLAPYREWIQSAIEGNMPWDVFVRSLLATRGDGWNHDSAAVGYYIRDRGMPHDNLANSMRIFLGKRMECAQCHDDPFGTSDRKDFYQLAAFTEGQYPLKTGHIEPLLRELRDSTGENTEEYRLARMIREQVHGMSLGGGGRGRINLPSDYQYRDGRPGETIGGRTPFGRTVRMSDRRDADDGREKLAEWVTQQTGRQFSAVIANRMWRRIMGRGISEPIDDFTPIEKSHHPALFTELADLMVALEYDLKAFQHVLLLTRTFQFATNPNPSAVAAGDDFHGRKIQRLTAEQIWDSLVTLAAGDPDRLPRATLDTAIRLNGRPVLAGRKSMPELSGEVLALSSESDFRRYFDNLLREIRTHRDNPDAGTQNGSPAMQMSMRAASPQRRGGLVRASELPSPAPRGHFLHLFGQSDREVVDASSRDPNVGQVLTLMNGFVQRELVNNPEAHVYRSLEGATGDRERIRRLCIAILSRPPTAAEMDWMLEEIEQRGDNGLRNLVAALVMSSEFLFLQ